MKKLKGILSLIDKTIEEKQKYFKEFYSSGASFCSTGYSSGYIDALHELKKQVESLFSEVGNEKT